MDADEPKIEAETGCECIAIAQGPFTTRNPWKAAL